MVVVLLDICLKFLLFLINFLMPDLVSVDIYCRIWKCFLTNSPFKYGLMLAFLVHLKWQWLRIVLLFDNFFYQWLELVFWLIGIVVFFNPHNFFAKVKISAFAPIWWAIRRRTLNLRLRAIFRKFRHSHNIAYSSLDWLKPTQWNNLSLFDEFYSIFLNFCFGGKPFNLHI